MWTDVNWSQIWPAGSMPGAKKFWPKQPRRRGLFLIYVSTDYVFDGRSGMYKGTTHPIPSVIMAKPSFWTRSMPTALPRKLSTVQGRPVAKSTSPFGLKRN